VRFAGLRGLQSLYETPSQLALGAELEQAGGNGHLHRAGFVFSPTSRRRPTSTTFAGTTVLKRIYEKEKTRRTGGGRSRLSRAPQGQKPMVTVGGKGIAAKFLARHTVAGVHGPTIQDSLDPAPSRAGICDPLAHHITQRRTKCSTSEAQMAAIGIVFTATLPAG